MKKMSYLSHIDSIRAVAVLLVVLYHLDLSLFQGGFIGVDVFFVISGFLITRLLNHEFVQTGKINFKTFYVRRVRRLMPTLFLTISLVFILTFLAFSPSDFMNATKSMFMSSVALSNFHFLGLSDYFDIASHFKPLLHTWSLGIEEQFYLLYPVTLLLLMKLFSKKKRGVIISMSAIFAFSLFITIYTSKCGVPSNFANFFLPKGDISSGVSSLQFYLLPFRMFEFLIGGIIALVQVQKIKSEYFKLSLNLLGLTMIVAFAMIFNKNTPYLGSLNLFPCIGAGLLLLFPPSKHLKFIFNNKFLRYIGEISYTLYLIHWVVIVFYRYLFDGEFNPMEQIAMFVVMILLSSLIYKYYENSLRYKTAKFSIKSNRSLLLMLIIAILSVYIVKLKVNYAQGCLWRLSDENLVLIEKIGVPKDYHKNNWGGAGYKVGWVGKQPKEGIEPDMIWLGDSHAAHYLYGLDSVMVKKNRQNIYISNWFSTLKLPEIIRNDRDGYSETSKKLFKENLEFINNHPSSIVILSHSWVDQIALCETWDEFEKKYKKIKNDSTGWKIIARKIGEFHNMSGSDRVFIIIGETPSSNSSELNYIEKLLRPKYLLGLVPTISTFKHNRILFNKFLKDYFQSNENIIFIDPSDAFCKDGVCLRQKNNEIYFSDGGHLSKTGSLKVVKFLENRFVEILDKN